MAERSMRPPAYARRQGDEEPAQAASVPVRQVGTMRAALTARNPTPAGWDDAADASADVVSGLDVGPEALAPPTEPRTFFLRRHAVATAAAAALDEAPWRPPAAAELPAPRPAPERPPPRYRLGGAEPPSEPPEEVRRLVAADPPRAGLRLRALLLPLIILALLAGGAGFLWIAWDRAIGTAGEPPLVRASQRPFKEPPDAAAGVDTAADQASVATAIARGEAGDARVERILPRSEPGPMSIAEAAPDLSPVPPAEEPVPVPAAAGPGPAPSEGVAPDAAAGTGPEGTTPIASPPATQVGGEAAAAGADEQRPLATLRREPAPLPPTVPARPPAAATRVVAPASPQPPAGPSGGPRQLTAAKPSASTPPAPAASTATGAASATPPRAVAAVPATPPPGQRGGPAPWRIQVAAVGSRTAAEGAWKTLRSRHPGVLASMPVNFDEVRLGQASLVRVQAGAFADRDQAAKACAALRTGGTECFVVGVR